MGGDIRDFREGIGKSVARGSNVTVFPSKVGFDLIPLNTNLGIVQAPKYHVDDGLSITHDIAKIVPLSQLETSSLEITAATADVVLDIPTPKDRDHVYALLSVTLAVARAVRFQVIPNNTNDGPYVANKSTAATIQVLDKTQLPLIVPSGHFLRITVVGMLIADTDGSVSFQRVVKQRSLGFLFL